jgi:hypothetical protein
MTCIDRRSLLTRGAAVVGAASGDDGRKASEANRIAVIFVVALQDKSRASSDDP